MLKEKKREDKYPKLMVEDDIILYCDREEHWKDIIEDNN